jgi:hypothetical protein
MQVWLPTCDNDASLIPLTMEHLLALTSGQKGYFVYCVFCFNFLIVFHEFCTQKEFHIHADLEFRRPMILLSIGKIIPANDFIFATEEPLACLSVKVNSNTQLLKKVSY